jgi:uncharacterized membrane protein YbaN (DUF454 family)
LDFKLFGIKDKIIGPIREFLENNGIEPLYASTAFMIVVFICYWRNFKNWNDISTSTKRLTIAVTFATIVTSFFCIIKLLGIADL